MYQDGSGAENKELSTRVNAARLTDYVGKLVRLACRTLKMDGNTITVEASDGGQVTVFIPPNANITDPFIEVIGIVQNPTTVKMAACVNMGSDLDMKLVNDTVELIHDPRFYHKMFC
ncbi:replication factor A protein 3 [Gymnopilus junonius]|uniref:Replication factor A protein 3 n=1 Tax=Gymnopilus junonius TaxID=109634 RepID=A0A9P5NF71_GYMJU|nr:replication factor A protein 3 [Gymnopilus junonius]